MKIVFFLISLFLTLPLFAAEQNVVNVYAWSRVIPDFIIRQFEKETGIKVNFSTYDSNEIMYAKLKTNNPGYDLIEPSTYYIDRMRHQGMLEKLDLSMLHHFRNINPYLLNRSYDPHNHYSIPFNWGITGIFYNKHYFPSPPSHWADLWDHKYVKQLLILDDARDVFAIALRVLGYSTNDSDPEHIKKAYIKLKALMSNVKMFSNSPLSILIDEDATIGMAWNGDIFKASKENPQLSFLFPKEGFVIWIDSFSIPKGAPHPANAYRFLNFIMRADVALAIALDTRYSTANLAAQKLLPDEIKNNPMIYPPTKIMRRGEVQTDVNDTILALYETYWEKLKIGA